MIDDNLTQKAIDLALNCKWNEAITINLSILKLNPNDVDALNRLSRAYYEKGNIKKAKNASSKVIKIEPSNPIALKAVEKYKYGNKENNSLNNKKIDPSVFIEEPGKTKLINLINTSSSDICSCLDSGDEIFLITHTHRVSLTNSEGKYLGRLTDDLSAKLRKFIKGGNKYKVYVKSVDGKKIKILIKETFRGVEFKNTQSFPRETLEPVAENFTNSDF